MSDFVVSCSVTRSKCAGHSIAGVGGNCYVDESSRSRGIIRSRGASLTRSDSDARDSSGRNDGGSLFSSVYRSSSCHRDAPGLIRKAEVERLREEVRRNTKPRPRSMWNAIESWQAHLDEATPNGATDGDGGADCSSSSGGGNSQHARHRPNFSKVFYSCYSSDSDWEYDNTIGCKWTVSRTDREGDVDDSQGSLDSPSQMRGDTVSYSEESLCSPEVNSNPEVMDSVEDIIHSVEAMTRSALNSAEELDVGCFSTRSSLKDQKCDSSKTSSGCSASLQHDSSQTHENANITTAPSDEDSRQQRSCSKEVMDFDTFQSEMTDAIKSGEVSSERFNTRHHDCSLLSPAEVIAGQERDIVICGMGKPRQNSFGEDGMSSDFGSSLEFLDSSNSEIGYYGVDVTETTRLGRRKAVSDDSDLGSSKDDLNSDDSSSDNLSEDFVTSKCAACDENQNDVKGDDSPRHDLASLTKDSSAGKCRLCVDFSTDEGTFSISSDTYSPPLLIGHVTPFASDSSSSSSSVLPATNRDISTTPRDDLNELPSRVKTDLGDIGSVPGSSEGNSQSVSDVPACWDSLSRDVCSDSTPFVSNPPTHAQSSVLPNVAESPYDERSYLDPGVVAARRLSGGGDASGSSKVFDSNSHSSNSDNDKTSCDNCSNTALSAHSNDPCLDITSNPIPRVILSNEIACCSRNGLEVTYYDDDTQDNDILCVENDEDKLYLKAAKICEQSFDTSGIGKGDKESNGSTPEGASTPEEASPSMAALSTTNVQITSKSVLSADDESKKQTKTDKEQSSNMSDRDSPIGDKACSRDRRNPFFSSVNNLDLPLTSLERQFPSFFASSPSIQIHVREPSPSALSSSESPCRVVSPSSETPTTASTVSETNGSSCSLNSVSSKRSSSTISKRYSSCIKTVTSALRRLPSPSKVLHRSSSSIFGSHKCVYDLQLASLAYFSSCPSTPVTGKRRLTATPSLLTFTSTSASQSLPPSPSTPFPATPPSTPSSLRLLTPSASPLASLPTTPMSCESRILDPDEQNEDRNMDSFSLSSSFSAPVAGLPLSSLSSVSSKSSSTTPTPPTKKLSSIWSSKCSSSKFQKLRYRSLSLDSRISSSCPCQRSFQWDDQTDSSLCVSSYDCSTNNTVCAHRPFLLHL